MIRTTVRLDEEIFKDARKKAIDERVAFADVVNEALKRYLGKSKRAKSKKITGAEFLARLAKYNLRGAPKDLAQKHDEYLWK